MGARLRGFLVADPLAWILPLTVALAALLAFLPSLGLKFTDWDDADYVTKCPYIKYFTWENIRFFLTQSYFSNYHPITSLTYLVEYRLWRLWPVGYHATNLGLHVANALLCFWFVRVLTRRRLVALVCALLFAVHPQRVEVVAWIAARKDLLCTFFFLPSLTLWVLYCRDRTPRNYWASLVLFVASILSKPMAITLPVLLLLIDRMEKRPRSWGLLVEKVPFFLVSAAMAFVTFMAQRAGGSIREDIPLAWSIKIQTVSYGLVFYLGKLVWPANLLPLYPYGTFIEDVLPAPAFFAPFVLLALASLAWFAAERSKWWAFGVAFYVITLLPVLQIVPIGGAYAADRYTYIPLLGIVLAASVTGVRLLDRLGPLPRRVLAAGFAAAVAVMMVLSARQCRIWYNGTSLWEYTSARLPRASTAFNNLGAQYTEIGEFQKGILALNRAISLNPVYAMAFNNRGNCYFVRGDYRKAAQDYEACIALAPQHAPPYNNLGTIMMATGKDDDAIAAYSKAISMNPFYTEAFVNRAAVLRKHGKVHEALSDLLRAVEINPNMPMAYNDLGNMMSGLGRFDDAEKMFLLALRYAPESGEILQNRGTMYKSAGLHKAAIEDYDRAEASGWRTEDLYNNRGGAYAEQGDHEAAIREYTKAIDLVTTSPVALCNRGVSYMKTGRKTEAMADLNRAIATMPQMPMAYKNRGVLNSTNGKIAEAIADFNRALELSPDFNDARINRAANHFILKNYGAAWADVRELQKRGGKIQPRFLEQLEAASGVKNSTAETTGPVGDK